MAEEKKKEEKPKEQSAKEIAEIMAANMKANMEDPEFWNRQDRIRAKVVHKVLKERELREQKQQKESE